MYLSAILFMLSLENISVSIFSPGDSKWASGEMSEAEESVTAGLAVGKTSAYGVASLSRVIGQLVAFFWNRHSYRCFCVLALPFFFVDVFLFQRVVNFKRIFLKNKKTK